MRLRGLLTPLIYFLGCLLYAIPDWLTDEFGSVTIDQILYHLRFGSEGLLTSDPELTVRFLWRAVLVPALLALVLWGLGLWGNHLLQHPHKQPMPWVLGLVAWLKSAARRAVRAMVRLAHSAVPRSFALVVLGVGMAYAVDSLSLVRHVRAYFGEDYFSGSYVDPHDVKLTKDKPKNLVLIYVESLEDTYSDPNLFGRDLLARLNAHKSRGISFSDYREVMGAHFTIAGLVSSQCGLPLKSVALFGGNDQGERMDRFLPKARCLGDILADKGYTNVFLNGSSLAFAGVGKFFHDHQYGKVMGREEWIRLGEKEAGMSGWGLRDDDLFRRAREELTALMKSRKPFNLNILTIDMHHPYGHLSPTCAKAGYRDFEGIVECTANQVADFIDFIAAKGWLDKVTVVVQGDHLAMGNTSYDKLIQNPNRRVFNLILGADRKLQKNTETVTHFDMLPTILTAMGFRVEGERAGLGYAAIGPMSVPRPPDRIAKMTEQLMNYSAKYSDLWDSTAPDLKPAAVAAPDPDLEAPPRAALRTP